MHSSDLAFYIVAQGNVHVHAKFPQSNDHDNHLLYNVSVGGTVSSFFSIISIFTADFQLPKSLANLDEFLNPPSEPITPVHRQIYQNMVAKASEPTTLVVIPAQAFKKLTCQFKTAAAHISQVILTRFQRTTFLIMYKYLGLTNELLEVEKRIYDDVGYGLPVHLFPQKLRDELRLKHRGSVSTTPKQPSANSSWLHNVQRPLIIQDESDIAETIFKCISHLIGVRKHTPQPSSLNTTVGPSNTEKLLFNQKRRNSHSSLPAKPFDTDDFSSTVSSKSFELSSDEETSTPMVQIQSFQEGHVLIHEQERSRGIYFLIDGVLKATAVPKKRFGQDLSNPPFNNGFLIHAGGLVGYLAALTSNVSFVTVTAQTDITVGFIPKDRLDKLVEQDPNAILCLSKRLLDQITPLVFQIDAALEWSQLNAGQVLFRQEDVASDIFFVLMGRLRALDQSETPKAIAEYGANESVGEMEVIMDRKRPFTLHAIRDSEIAIIPKTLFNILSTHYPEIMLTIARMIAEKSDSGSTYSHKSDQNLRTVCLFPVSSQVPILKFSDNLYDSLVHAGATVSRLDSTTVVNHLGRHAFKKLGRLKLASWLNEQEETHRIVIFIADSNITPWTRRCIRHADSIFVLALSDQDKELSGHEKFLNSMKMTTRKELILLHAHNTIQPGSTASWLEKRPWIHSHYHVFMKMSAILQSPPKKQNTLLNLKHHFENYYRESAPKSKTSSSRSDFSRIARRLLSQTIGVALGGGGARGIAHIGVLRAFEEAGIPIDIICGTSMGAFVGALYAKDNTQLSIHGRAKMLCSRIVSPWRNLLDLTYPITSMFTGHELNRAIWKCFSDSQIQDCWIPYFATSTNITWSKLNIHTSGYIWRYVRASMSLSGLVPPLCDKGDLLMDGGYLNNLPADQLRKMGVNSIIAIDVGNAEDTTPINYGDSLSGWWVILNRWNPFRPTHGRIPEISDIQSRLAYVSSVSVLEQVKKMPGCYYLKPPVSHIGIMEFQSFSKVEEIGYEYGKKIVQDWQTTQVISTVFGVKQGTNRRASI